MTLASSVKFCLRFTVHGEEFLLATDNMIYRKTDVFKNIRTASGMTVSEFASWSLKQHFPD